MKYYKMNGLVREIADHHLIPLLRNEPTAKEISYEEYQEGTNTGQKVTADPNTGDGSKGVGENKAGADGSQVPRGEAIKTLKERGFDYKDLRRKTKQELNDLL